MTIVGLLNSPIAMMAGTPMRLHISVAWCVALSSHRNYSADGGNNHPLHYPSTVIDPNWYYRKVVCLFVTYRPTRSNSQYVCRKDNFNPIRSCFPLGYWFTRFHPLLFVSYQLIAAIAGVVVAVPGALDEATKSSCV